MTGFTFVTKRKLKAALALAVEDGKFEGLNPDDFTTMFWGKEACLFHPAGYVARIITRTDCTIFISRAEECHPQMSGLAPHTM